MKAVIGLILLVAFFVLLVILIQYLAKSGSKRIDAYEKKQALKKNVFVKAHNQMLKEKEMHPEYIKWMDENNIEGVPFEVTKSVEEIKAELEMQKLLNPTKQRRSR